jgi:type II secretory pathway component GspD/PulD (secretin)
MYTRTLWLIGLLCTLLTATMSLRPGHTESHVDGSHSPSGGRIHERTIQMNFRNVDILQIITLMSELTGQNFLVDDKVRGKVTLIAPQPVTPAEAYEIFLAALAMQGFTVVPQGPINKIIPSQNATVQPLPTRMPPSRPRR